MRAVIQRVMSASVISNTQPTGNIGAGLLVFLGIEHDDELADTNWLVDKIRQMRIFPDEQGKMNLTITHIEGQILIVSQFTLFASTKKGNRPSFIRAARPEDAIPLYEKFKQQMELFLPNKIESGIFGADMQVTLVNDGPVTILLDSRNKE